MSRSDVVDDVVPNNNLCGYGVTISLSRMSNNTSLNNKTEALSQVGRRRGLGNPIIGLLRSGFLSNFWSKSSKCDHIPNDV